MMCSIYIFKMEHPIIKYAEYVYYIKCGGLVLTFSNVLFVLQDPFSMYESCPLHPRPATV